MLLSKIMLRTPEDVQSIMSGKLTVKYAGKDLDAMRAVADASHKRSLADFQAAVKQYRQELEEDVIVRAHLGSIVYRLFHSWNVDCRVCSESHKDPCVHS